MGKLLLLAFFFWGGGGASTENIGTEVFPSPSALSQCQQKMANGKPTPAPAPALAVHSSHCNTWLAEKLGKLQNPLWHCKMGLELSFALGLKLHGSSGADARCHQLLGAFSLRSAWTLNINRDIRPCLFRFTEILKQMLVPVSQGKVFFLLLGQ